MRAGETVEQSIPDDFERRFHGSVGVGTSL